MEEKRAPIIGLAGQSCAGKNVAAEILEKRGFYCIDADLVAHEVLAAESEEIAALFSEECEKNGLQLINADGSLNRRKLGELLFSDPVLLKKHEAFIFPKISAVTRKRINEAFLEDPHRPVLLNAPTLHKTKLLDECAFVLYITAPKILRIWRCKKRDKLSLKEIFKRFSNQTDFYSQYVYRNADIERVANYGTASMLEKKTGADTFKKGFINPKRF
ncbi:dephospho-CoA kinase [Treponema phagedenis]|uniref:dephospho-CoA kinase n=1 Tax=Treponema phagedenis TaxID=162 RepID=UPI0015A3DF00|nr:dephospho-CoA kinase [Treponema phagedenis]NVP25664.1 dephospho-CoA kinase [Treponema phagedenis]QLC60146.1 dephospho-CoA kinase [Treponema phagedenis]